MVAPVRQRCPNCGQYFMGSDCLGDPCPDCDAILLGWAAPIEIEVLPISQEQAELLELMNEVKRKIANELG